MLTFPLKQIPKRKRKKEESPIFLPSIPWIVTALPISIYLILLLYVPRNLCSIVDKCKFFTHVICCQPPAISIIIPPVNLPLTSACPILQKKRRFRSRCRSVVCSSCFIFHDSITTYMFSSLNLGEGFCDLFSFS